MIFGILELMITVEASANFNYDDMWKNTCFLTRLISVCINAAETAGTTIREVMVSGDLKILDKDPEGLLKDLQTEADRSAQAGIEAKLKSSFGDQLQIIGEEELPEKLASNFAVNDELIASMHYVALTIGDRLPETLRILDVKDVLVWVDPLDGTSEFVRGQKDPSLLQQVTVLIGITYQGRPIAGVVHQPYFDCAKNTQMQQQRQVQKGRTIWGVKDVGIFGLDVCREKPSDAIAVTTASHSNNLVEEALHALQQANLISTFKRVGGAGFKVLCCLEDATAYVFASKGCKKWDTAAPEALLLAAGGTLTDISGRQLQYEINGQMMNSGGILATAPWVHDHQVFVEAIPKKIKDSLPEKL